MVNFTLNFRERRLNLKLQNRKYIPRKTVVDGRDEVRDSCQKPSRPPTTPGPSEHMGTVGICLHFLFVNTCISPIAISVGRLPPLRDDQLSMVRNIFFSPLVLSKPEKNTLVLLSLYFF